MKNELKNPIHQDLLADEFKRRGITGISDEHSRIIGVEVFKTLFIYKYGGFLSQWSIYLENGHLILQNASDFQYRFPLQYDTN